MDLHVVPIPSIASLLFWIESRCRAPLGPDTVSFLVRHVPSISLPTTAMDDLAKTRGYSDIDVHDAWAQFEFLRTRAVAQGAEMGSAIPSPQAQLAKDLVALERIMTEIDPSDLLAPAQPSQGFAPEQAHEVCASVESHALRFIQRLAYEFDQQRPLGEILLGFVDINDDDFSPLEPNAHMLAWLGERPFQLIHQRLEAGLQEQAPGCTLVHIHCEGEPYYLTGFREDGPESVLKRMGVACRASLSASLGDRQEQDLDLVLMIVGVDLDSDPRVSVGMDHPEVWNDIHSALTARMYGIDG
ncbi:MAG: hypothetical protein ACIAQU_11955 [Phycisphaerales bacterium JB064]